MSSLRVLITNLAVAHSSGTETYVRDLAAGLTRLGHRPIVYSTVVGPLGEEIAATGTAVVDDLARLRRPPDVIHGNHHHETMTALLHFPGVPGVFFCHDRVAWHDEAPLFPRLRWYVAVDDTCAERFELHRVRIVTGRALELFRALVWTQAWGFVAIAVLLVGAQVPINRSLIALFIAYSSVLLLLGKVAQRQWARRRRGEALALVIGGSGGHEMLAASEQNHLRGRQVEVMTDPDAAMLRERLRIGGVDEVVVAGNLPTERATSPRNEAPRVSRNRNTSRAIGESLACHWSPSGDACRSSARSERSRKARGAERVGA